MTDIKKYEPLWGAWQVESLIGEGSFGKVYKIRRDEFGKTYYSAVKLISIPQSETDLREVRSEGMDEASIRSYFHALVTDIVQEISIMSEFRGHSNIVSFEDYIVIEKESEIGWDILIRMELLKSLAEDVTERLPTSDDIIKLGIHICHALEICAAHNTIHRDIKPDNIFISRHGDYKLGDFGISRQMERTIADLSKKGTYAYMAPEVFKGEAYGAGVDIYSLGIVMYRLLNNNRMPFLPDFPAVITHRDRETALRRRMSGEALPAIKGINPTLNEIVQIACAFDHQNRFQTPAAMREALKSITTPFTPQLSLHRAVAPVEVKDEARPDVQDKTAEVKPQKNKKDMFFASAVLVASLLSMVIFIGLYANNLISPVIVMSFLVILLVAIVVYLIVNDFSSITKLVVALLAVGIVLGLYVIGLISFAMAMLLMAFLSIAIIITLFANNFSNITRVVLAMALFSIIIFLNLYASGIIGF